MSVKSFVTFLIIMVAMQSGIVAADTHDFVFAPSNEQQTALDNHQDRHQYVAQQVHDTPSGSECDYCFHAHCSHFIAIDQSDSRNMADFTDSFFSAYLPTTETGFSTSMYRPPRI